MEGNNPRFIFGQNTTPSSYPFHLDPSFVIQPATNDLTTSPFLEAIASPPIGTSLPTIRTSSFSRTNFGLSMLHSNVRTPSINPFATRNLTVPMTSNSSSAPAALAFQDNRHIYSGSLPSIISFGNQYQLPNPYLAHVNPSYLYSMANNGLDIARNVPNSSRDSSLPYKCSICCMEFPTSQAYGGHMSSHSKAKKAREKLESSRREAKRARPDTENGSLLNLAKRKSSDQSRGSIKGKEMVQIRQLQDREELCTKRKGKNITMTQEVNEAEEIRAEVVGYASDESANNETHV